MLWVYPKRKDTYFYPSASTSETFKPPSDLVIEYGFGKKGNLHYMCKSCGCQIYEYRPRAESDSRNTSIKGWEKEDGSNGDFGLNVALFSDASDYLGDVQGLKEHEGHKGKKLGGLQRDDVTKGKEPLYELKL